MKLIQVLIEIPYLIFTGVLAFAYLYQVFAFVLFASG